MSEPTFLEAVARIKKELAGVGILVAAIGGGGGWFGLGKLQATEVESDTVATFIGEKWTKCEERFAEQRDLCLGLVENERENTAHWRDQCGGP